MLVSHGIHSHAISIRPIYYRTSVIYSFHPIRFLHVWKSKAVHTKGRHLELQIAIESPR